MNCLITGASVGIGHDLALKMASMNYNLLLTYYSNQKACELLQKEILTKYQVKCIIEKCDLSIEEDIIRIISRFKKEIGNLDILINNASISLDNLFQDKTKKEFLKVLDVNIVGTFLISKYAYKIMNKDGLIINMASTDGIDTYSIYNIDYAVSKAGIIQLTKSMSLILDDIKTIAIAPNWVDTESTREMNQDYLKEEMKRIDQKKLIPVSTIVNKIIHLIGDKNIKSGSIIRIDGEENE